MAGKRARSKSKGKSSAAKTKKAAGDQGKPHFPIAQLHEFLERNLPGVTVKPEVAVFLCGVLEYVAAELLELSTNVSRLESGGSHKVTAAHIEAAIESDPELKELMDKVRGTAGNGGGADHTTGIAEARERG